MKIKLFRLILLSAFLIGLLAPAAQVQALGAKPTPPQFDMNPPVTGCSWNGSVDANWSTPGNWDAGCSGVGGIPGTGDTLTFPLGASNATMTDDLPAITLQSLIFSGALDYTLNGSNAISLTSGVDVQAGNQTINAPLTVAGPGVTFHAASGSNLAIGGTLNLGTYDVSLTVDTASGVIGMQILGAVNGSGAAKISKYGTGELQIKGDHNTKVFDIDLNAGSISTNPSSGTWLPFYKTITLASGTDLYLKNSGGIGSIAGSGNIHASSFFQIRQGSNTTFTGDIFGTQQMAVIGNGISVLTIDRSGGSLSYAGEINSNAGGRLKLANTTATSVPDFLASQGSLELNNSHVGVVQVGWSGGGSDYNGSLILSGSTANIASSITLLNNSSVTSVINSTTDYGRITVTSPVDLGAGAPTFDLQGSYTPISGDVFTIIQNTNSGAATQSNAAFSNLSQGGTIPFNTINMEADYQAAGNTAFTLSATTPDVTPPTVQSIVRTLTNPMSGPDVVFTVTFSEPVTGVDVNDFVPTTTGITGSYVSYVFPISESVYNVQVQTGTGNGTIRLDVPNTAVINDIAGNPLAGLPYTGGEAYTIVKTAPVLLSPADTAILPTNRPTFDWTDFPGAAAYQLQVSHYSSFSTTILNKSISGVANSFYAALTNLPASTLLYWRVRARTGFVYGPWSQVWSFTTGNPPSVPTLASPLNGALVAGPSPLFNWNNSAVSGGAVFDHYQIQIATSNTFTLPSIVHDNNVAGITNSQDNTAVLPAGATYYWRVRSWNAAGDYSAWSAVRSVKIKYAAPTLLLPADGSGAGTLLPTFTWSATAGATSYTIQVSRNSAFSLLVVSKTVAAPTFTAVTNLLAGTTYYWRVKVNGPYGPSAWSVVFSFTTP